MATITSITSLVTKLHHGGDGPERATAVSGGGGEHGEKIKMLILGAIHNKVIVRTL